MAASSSPDPTTIEHLSRDSLVRLDADGANLQAWMFNLPRFLRTKDLHGYLIDPEKSVAPPEKIDDKGKAPSTSGDESSTSTTSQPPTKKPNPEHAKWLIEAQKATDMMVRTLRPEHYPFVTEGREQPRIIYDLIVVRYSNSSIYAIQQAEQKISLLQYSSATTTMSAHITKFDSYVTQLAQAGKVMEENEKMLKLLLTISDPEWRVWVGNQDQWRQMGVIRGYAQLCNNLQAEAVRYETANMASSLHQSATALATMTSHNRQTGRNGRGGGNGGSRRQCFHCGRTGHVIADCRDKQNGLPQSTSGAAACSTFENSRGRFSTTQPVSANVSTVPAPPATPSTISSADFALFQAFLAFQKAQGHTTALQFTVAVARALDPTSMIIDGGCNNHVFQSRALFHDYVDLTNHIPIYVADDRAHPAVGRGSVSFTAVVGNPPSRHVVTLKNVLHCPGLSGNLISESQLAKTSELEITLRGSVKTVKLPDCTLLEAHEKNGLYRVHADLNTHVSSVKSNDSFVLA
jgi:hypothetical protein